MKKILGLLFLFYLITLPVLSYAHSAASFHCNGVGVVLLPSGFWVQSDWFCPHGNFFFQRGFHSFPNGFPVNRFLGFHGSWVIPAYPPSQGESWDVFVERYMKEHSRSENEEIVITFSDGELVKSASSQNTYLYAGASLHYVPDTKTLSAIGTKRDLKIISQKVLASLPVGESLPSLNDGLNTVNTGLDTVNKETKQAAEPIGKIWELPSSIHEGALKGYTDNPQENPYDR